MQAKVTELAKTELEAAGEDTSGMVESVSKLREQVLALSGVDILEANGKDFKSTTQIIRELAQVYEKLDGIDQANLLDLLAGKRGGNVLAAALQNWDIVEKTIQGASVESVDSMDQQLAVYNQSIQASLDKFHVAFQELSSDLINSDTIKGVVDFGTTVLKIIDALIEHIGVLGTAITGLGIAKIFSTAASGAKSVEGLTPAVSLLGEALSTGAGKGEAFGLVLEQLGAKAAGAGSALGTMFSSLGGFLASPAGWVTGIVAAVAAAGAIAYNIRKKQQEELKKQATATTEKWGDDKSSVDDFKRQYTELNDQLKDANLTESERIGIKQQLLDLQNQISAKYGADAGQLDLINGKYETQLGLISQITEKEAHRNLQNNREAYQQSIDEMTKDRTYTLFSNGSGSDLMKKIEMAYVQNGFKDQGDLSFDFTGDVTEADKNIRALMDRLEQLKATANDTEKQFIDSVIGATSKLLAKNNEILDANQANYQAYLEQSLYDDGYGDELAKYSKLVKEYNEALAGDDVAYAYKKRSEMLAYYRDNIDGVFEGTQYEDFFTGVTEQIDTASEKMMDWQDIVDDGTTYATNGLAKYTDIIRKTVGDIKKLKLDGVDIQTILGDPNSAMYKDMAQLARLWNPDINLNNPDDLQLFSDFLMKVVYGADAFGGSVDLAKSEFDDFMKSVSASIDTLDKVNAALVNGFKSGGLSARIDAETGKLTGDVKTIMDAYKVADASDIFERTADGIIVNRDALRELQAEQEKTIKDEFVDRIAEAQENYNNALNSGDTTAISYWKEQLDNVQLLAAAYDGATSAYQKWVEAQKGGEAGDQYDQVVSTALKRGKELYDKGLVGTNEFRAIAQLYSNEDLSTASIDEVTKAYEDGATTVKKYFTEGQDGAVAFADKMVELGYATKDANDEYDFYDGIDTQKVADDLGISVDLIESAFKKLSDYGFDIHFNFGDASIEDIRTQLKAWSDGGNVDLNVRPVIDTDLLMAAGWEDAGEGAATLFTSTFSNEAGDIAMNFTPIMTDENGNFKGVLSPSELTEYAESVIAGVREDDLHLKIGATFEGEDAIHQAGEVAEKMHEAHEELLVRGEFVFDDGELQYALDTATALRNRIDYLNNLKATTGVDISIENDEEVRQLSDNLLSVDDKEIRAKFGIDGVSDVDSVIQKYENGFEIPANITADASDIQTPTDTNATVDYSTGSVEAVGAQTAVLNYTTGTIEPVPTQTASIDYKTSKIEQVPDQSASINYSNGTIEQVPDQYATINYTASVSGLGALPDDGERRTIYLDTYTVEHYKGTVSKSVFQGLGSAGKVTSGSSHANGTLGKVGLKNDESALINELGAEIVVRPSDDSWMIFNDGKPTFANLKRGDVIFNADLTRQLLEKGEADDYARILSGNSHASGTLKGKAHATVKGGGSFKKAKSSSSGGGGGNGGGGGSDGGGSSNSTQDANDFNEILDEIQINIDRIERDIKNLDTIASDTFTNLTGRTSALNKELVKVRKEIKAQQTGYSRYLAKANSVGLNGTWAERVRNGENLTLDNVGDENLWEKIQEYQKWWNSRHLIHLTAGKLRRRINYNARMKYA